MEFATFTVSANQENVVIEKLSIILARGDQPVRRATVTGNSFDDPAFRSSARAGDRLIIVVEKISGSSEVLNDENKILQIPLI